MVESTETTATQLSCREAHLLLKVISVDKKFTKMSEEELQAGRHYIACNGCRKIGFATITGKTLTHKEALEAWAKRPGPLYLESITGGVFPSIKTFNEQLAIEHVWGRWVEWEGGHPGYNDMYESCPERSCSRLAYYWRSAGLSSHYDGERHVIGEIPFLISIFREEGWSLKNLLAIQKERVLYLLSEIRKVPKNLGHRADDMAEEIEANVKTLQALALGIQNPE